MSTIALRSQSLIPLSTEQVDANFNNLNLQKVEVSGATSIVYAVPENTAGQVVRRDASGNFSANTISASLSGNASTATTWQTARSLTLTGDVTGTITGVNGSANISVNTSIAKDYVASITGTANRISVSGSGIAAAVTLNLPQDIHTEANPTFAGAYLNNVRISIADNNTIDTSTGELFLNSAVGQTTVDDNLVVTGNLSVYGTLEAVTIETYSGPLFSIGGFFDDEKDRGIIYKWNNDVVDKIGFFGLDKSTGYFTFIPDATNAGDVISGTKGVIDAGLYWSNVLEKPSPVITINLTGDVTGSANTTLSSLASGTIDLATTIPANSIVLGTDTSGDYVTSISTGTPGAQTNSSGLTLTGSGESAVVQIAHADTSSVESVNNTSNTFIQDLEFDAFGHVTAVESGTVSINNGGFSVLTNEANSGLTGGGQLGTANQSTTTSLSISHTNIVTAGNFGDTGSTRTVNFGSTFIVPYVVYDSNGHLTAKVNKTLTIPALPVASTELSGIVDTGTQSFAGDKTFTGDISAANFNSSSDIRLKTNVVSIKNGLETINKLDPIEFDWILTGKKSAGVIAQQVQEILPHLVNENGDTLNLNYLGLIAYLISAVQELDQKVKQLTGEQS